MRLAFEQFAKRACNVAGSLEAVVIALALLLVWILAGFRFGFLNPIYQLIPNSIISAWTLLQVLLVQNAQTRGELALHIKLDELIRVTDAQNALIALEERSGDELRAIRAATNPIV